MELTACDSGVWLLIVDAVDPELVRPIASADEEEDEEEDDDKDRLKPNDPAELASSSFTGLGKKAARLEGEGRLVRARDRPRAEEEEEEPEGGEGRTLEWLTLPLDEVNDEE